MKKLLIIYVILGNLAAIYFLLAAADKGRRGLVVREDRGLVIVTTHPAQPMDLDPWRQPRLKFEMRWPKGAPEQAEIQFGFIMATKQPGKLCPEVFIREGKAWRPLHNARYEQQQSRAGTFEQVIIDMGPQEFYNIARAGQPATFRVCGIDFKLAGVEGEDLRESAKIWRKQ